MYVSGEPGQVTSGLQRADTNGRLFVGGGGGGGGDVRVLAVELFYSETRACSLIDEVSERSRSKSSPLEQTRSKLANPVELTGFDRG